MAGSIDPFLGCVLGLATGDALGAPHEGGVFERLVWRLIGRTRAGELRWTDDTQMAIDLAESLLEDGGGNWGATGGVNPDALAKCFAASYHWSRGYGPGTARVLKRIRRSEPWESASRSVYPEGSFGNGAAMRAPVLALFYPDDRNALLAAARSSARVTHAHPLGIDGAVLIALATQALLHRATSEEVIDTVLTDCTSPPFVQRIQITRDWLATGKSPSPKETASKLGNGIAAEASCVTAMYIALRHLSRPFDELMRFAIACGGDTDTIAAMAGAMWGIVNGPGALPWIKLEGREKLTDLATRLHRTS